MNTTQDAVPVENHDEITNLLKVLHETGRRLEVLTSGEVDTAADPEGRILLLRGTPAQLEQNEVARQAAILNALPANIALLDVEGTIVSVNEGWRLFAITNRMKCDASQGVGTDYLEICDKATGADAHDTHTVADGIRSVLNGSKNSFSYDYDCNSPTEQRWFHLSVTPLSGDRRSGVIVMHSNITESKRDQRNLVLLAERLALATEVAKVGVWEWDLASNKLTWDATMFAIYGFPETSMSYDKWSAAVHPEDLHKVESKLQRAIHRRSEESTEFRIFRPDGNMRYVSAAESAVVEEGGVVCRVIGVNIDITERKLDTERLLNHQTVMAHVAEHDFLTGLPNQLVMRDRIKQAVKMASRNNTKFAILFLDLDGFKHVNDSLGHSTGDKLLQSIARRLEQCARASDTVSRFGGDEFIILHSEALHPEGPAAAAARLLEALAGIHSFDQHEIQIGACIGISIYPDDGPDGDTLIKNADAAMYQAKAQGSSNYRFFHPDMNIRAMERQFIEQNLRRALERNELALHYQPKYHLKTRAIMGVEALLRWNHPVRGLISPATFIPIAEECGLILPIGMWVLEEACRQARAWLDAGLAKISLAVNVSVKQFESERFDERVLDILGRAGIEPDCLELEVTEGLLMKSPEVATALLQSLRRKGVRVAIDDFGTGYSSLGYLQRFPIDTLKVDQSFVRQIETAGGVSLVTTIINLGRNLGMCIVAEGVESEQEATILEALGCEAVQGYYFSRPVPPAAMAALLQQQV